MRIRDSNRGIGLGLRQMPMEKIPAAGVLSATFFCASLVHMSIGPSSVHLIVNGLAGLVLGWAAFPALFVALLLQAIFFGFGGLTVIGVNTANIAVPAVIVHYLCRPGIVRSSPRVAAIWGGIGGALSIALTTGCVALALSFSGRIHSRRQIGVFAHIPIMAIEAVPTAAAVFLIRRVKPELFGVFSTQPDPARVWRNDHETISCGAADRVPLAFAASAPALAHKVVAGAYASGDRIEGEIGFSDGTMAKNQPVEVLSEDGKKIGETRTNEDGVFTYMPTRKMPYIFHADMGGGHIANIRVEAADLPVNVTGAEGAPAPAPATAAAPAASASPAAADARLSDAERALLLQAVSNEIKPLRREIIALKEKMDCSRSSAASAISPACSVSGSTWRRDEKAGRTDVRARASRARAENGADRRRVFRRRAGKTRRARAHRRGGGLRAGRGVFPGISGRCSRRWPAPWRRGPPICRCRARCAASPRWTCSSPS